MVRRSPGAHGAQGFPLIGGTMEPKKVGQGLQAQLGRWHAATDDQQLRSELEGTAMSPPNW
jgi:hypothetical protein